jgi:hypothetical protein
MIANINFSSHDGNDRADLYFSIQHRSQNVEQSIVAIRRRERGMIKAEAMIDACHEADLLLSLFNQLGVDFNS